MTGLDTGKRRRGTVEGLHPPFGSRFAIRLLAGIPEAGWKRLGVKSIGATRPAACCLPISL